MPGLSVVVLPALALAGYAGVQALLILLSAAVAFVVWRAARTLTGDAGAAWFAWAATTLTTPFVFLSFTVFPDGVGAMLVMAVVAMLVSLDGDAREAAQRAGPSPEPGSRQPERPWRWWLAAGMACAALPWLHPRYAVLAGSLGVILLGRIMSRPRALGRACAFLALPALSAAGWFAYFYVIYGSTDPSSAYGRYTQMAAGNIARGIPGLLFDQQFGLLPNAPVYALGPSRTGPASSFAAQAWRRAPRSDPALHACHGGVSHVVGRQQFAGPIPGARSVAARPSRRDVVGGLRSSNHPGHEHLAAGDEPSADRRVRVCRTGAVRLQHSGRLRAVARVGKPDRQRRARIAKPVPHAARNDRGRNRRVGRVRAGRVAHRQIDRDTCPTFLPDGPG